jgi:hypothetical protein
MSDVFDDAQSEEKPVRRPLALRGAHLGRKPRAEAETP